MVFGEPLEKHLQESFDGLMTQVLVREISHNEKINQALSQCWGEIENLKKQNEALTQESIGLHQQTKKIQGMMWHIQGLYQQLSGPSVASQHQIGQTQSDVSTTNMRRASMGPNVASSVKKSSLTRSGDPEKRQFQQQLDDTVGHQSNRKISAPAGQVNNSTAKPSHHTGTTMVLSFHDGMTELKSCGRVKFKRSCCRCRKAKVKCGKEKPQCHQCQIRGAQCEYDLSALTEK